MVNQIMTSTPITARSNFQPPINYFTLEDVFNLYPLKENLINVPIFAVIQSYNTKKHILTVMDDTREYFDIEFIKPNSLNSSKNDAPRLPTRTGDIIRIDKLFLCEKFSRKCEIQDVIIFESFTNEIFSPLPIHEKEFTDQDHDKVINLTNFLVSSLLDSKIRQIFTKNYFCVNSAFQVLCKLKYDNRIILACYNGSHKFDDYPCMQLIKITQIIHTLSGMESKPSVYSEEFIKKIYDEHKIIFISIYGVHRVVAKVLRPLDFIVIYNLLIKSDSAYYAKHTYIVNDGFDYGRCVRLAGENSEIAIALKTQIEKNCLLGESLNQSENRFDHSLSQMIDVTSENMEQEQAPIKRKKFSSKDNQMVSFFFSNTLDDSMIDSDVHSILCTHFEYTNDQKEIIHKHFHTRKDFCASITRLKSFSELIERNDEGENFFCIDAKFHSLTFDIQNSINPFESMSVLRKYSCLVSCGNYECGYYDTFESFFEKSSNCLKEKEEQLLHIDEDGTFHEIDDNDMSDNKMDKLKCPVCQTKSANIYLDFIIILQDYDGDLVLTRLTGNEANKIFNCSTIDLCKGTSSLLLQRIPAFFKHIFHVTNEQTECSQKITWTLTKSSEENTFNLIDISIMNQHISCGILTENMIPN